MSSRVTIIDIADKAGVSKSTVSLVLSGSPLVKAETRTRVELRLAYGVAGSGVAGWIAERIAAPTVRSHLRRSLQQLKRQVEHEQLRAAAAARREAKQRAAAGD